MKKQDIKFHLKDYSIYSKRKTTINHAFASALSIADSYDENRVDEALTILGQDPDSDLLCVYCESPAETWDHIIAVVKNGKFSGYGHQINNLVPCCKNCNSAKGNKDWKVFLQTKRTSRLEREKIILNIEHYITFNTTRFADLLDEEISLDINKLDKIKEQFFELMQRGDQQAELIREKLRKKIKQM